MKKILTFALSLPLMAGLTFSFTACKKGDDDPAISLRSRDARITGEWKLTQLESMSASESEGSKVSYHTSFNGSIMTDKITVNGNSETEFSTFSMNLTIDKGGKMKTQSVTNGDISEETDYWSWVNTTKNKTGINLGEDGGFFEILELRNSKMVLVSESSSFYKALGSSNSTISNGKSTLTFEKN
ncbi:MAG: hypothetical protein ACK4ND_15370 [Cytophagaceae bacterium]